MLEEYQQILMNNPTETEVKSDIQAMRVLMYLSQPDRQLFSGYYNSLNRKYPQSVISDYLKEKSASPLGTRMGEQIKEVVLRRTRTNNHKSAMLGAVGQAYLDLCLAVSIAQYCKPDTGEDLPYSEYIDLYIKSVDSLFKGLDSLSKSFCSAGISWYDGDLKSLMDSYNNGQMSKSVAKTRIETALKIIYLWEKDQIKYSSTYESIEKKVIELVEETHITEQTDKIKLLKFKVEFTELVLEAYSMEDFNIENDECKRIQDRLIELKKIYGFDIQSVKKELGL